MEEKETKKANCFECKWRANLPGDAHSRCNHPLNKSSNNPFEEMMAIFASVGRVDPVTGNAARELNIQASEHGIRKGWFNWPYNYDPVWLLNCDGFEENK